MDDTMRGGDNETMLAAKARWGFTMAAMLHLLAKQTVKYRISKHSVIEAFSEAYDAVRDEGKTP
jgi:hypothetical protein